MTLGDYYRLTAEWKDFPPTNMLLKALLEGLGGKLDETVSDSQISQLEREAGARLPILRGMRDPVLAKYPPVVLDFEEMKKRNFRKIQTRAMETLDEKKAK